MLKRVVTAFAVIADMNTIWPAAAIAKNEDIKLVLQITVDGLRGKTVDRPARPVDIAPTLAAVLGIHPIVNKWRTAC
ncbi:MAG: hypothetical protein WBV18_08255 [Methyloceanibacter sp.]|jgi:hypothetical protein|uniref:hypothetical protein n=1 Tax=Methyloceanibacter sp. TaxID=1965321 RepID=UPI003C32BC3E